MQTTMEYLDTCNADGLREAINDYEHILSKPSLCGIHETTQIALDYAISILDSKTIQEETMPNFTDMHGRSICDGAEIYFNGRFPDEIPTIKRMRDGVAIIDGDKLIFAVIINDQLQGIGLYWELDNEPCHDLILTEEVEIFEPTIIKYRGITAEISACRRGYKCIVTDAHGNEVDWFVRADTIQDAITKASSHFDEAIRYLRGFVILAEFSRRVER